MVSKSIWDKNYSLQSCFLQEWVWFPFVVNTHLRILITCQNSIQKTASVKGIQVNIKQEYQENETHFYYIDTWNWLLYIDHNRFTDTSFQSPEYLIFTVGTSLLWYQFFPSSPTPYYNFKIWQWTQWNQKLHFWEANRLIMAATSTC